MNTAPHSKLSLREALRRAVLALCAATAVPRTEAMPEAPQPFVPENDYPFFGAEPPRQ